MSGGAFDYKEESLLDIGDSILFELRNDLRQSSPRFSNETHQRMREASLYLSLGYVYAHWIDCFLSGDFGEETFHKKLIDDLSLLKEDFENEREDFE